MNEENKELVVRDNSLIMSKALPSGEEAETLFKWAAVLSDTKYYQELVASGGKNALAAILLAARDLDISASQAINSGLYIVKGKVSLSAQLMNMMVRRKGHSIVKVESTDTICTWQGVRKDNGDKMTSTFTIDDAKKAGLLSNQVWSKYPTRMLSNRAFSFLAKELFSDCIGNACIEGEMDFIDVTPPVAQKADSQREDVLDFVKLFDIENLQSAGSKFIDHISARTGETRSNTIFSAAQNADRFAEKLEQFSKKIENEV